ncbi:EpsD family peptidyl-prolyl cis-trans isomerase [Chitinivorax sp. B]|uniref:EpsD family peptidyl-prolyl cis-trans isomerase n=1 Tax=Chitinivorax sp. B TaxID=2502235 RepID=UPI0010FA1162|nr:EpsD family peptidyl-prolyl cis-trans isomerase [Chitinivorax sp. B]
MIFNMYFGKHLIGRSVTGGRKFHMDLGVGGNVQITRIALALCVPAVVLMAGCGKKDAAQEASQVVAKVGETEITVHQLNHAMASVPAKPEQAAEVRKQVLEGLVEQQALVNLAMESKLDRDPAALLAMEAAKQQVLARHYLERQLGQSVEVSEEKVKAYFSEHPQLFEHRKIYELNEMIVQGGNSNLPVEIAKRIEAGESVAAIKSFVEQSGGKASISSEVKAAEQIPLAVLPKLASLPERRALLVPAAGRLTVIELTGSRLEPVDYAKAKPVIGTYLQNQARAEKVKSLVADARSKAQISYVGEFAGAAPVAVPASAATADVKVRDDMITQGVGALK